MKVAPEPVVKDDELAGSEGETEQSDSMDVQKPPTSAEEESLVDAGDADEVEKVIVGESSDEMNEVQPKEEEGHSEIVADVTPDESVDVLPIHEQVDEQPRTLLGRMRLISIPQWLPLSLGLLTGLLLVITISLSARRR